MNIDSSSLYRDILKRSFFITAKNRFLWIFGFFATFLGLGSIYELVIHKSLANSELFTNAGYKVGTATISGFVIAKNLTSFGIGNLLLLIGAVLLSLALFVFLIWLAVNSLGALIFASKNLDAKKNVGFLKSYDAARGKFWRLFFINIIGKILIFVFLFITGGLFSAILINQSAGRGALFLLAYLILVALSLVISFLTIYASCFAVLKASNIKKSIVSAWRLFTEHWVISAEAAVIMFLINAAVKLLLFIAMAIFSLPFMLLLIIFYYSGAAAMSVILIALWVVTMVLLMIFAGSFFSSYQLVAWTLLFDRITKGGVLSKIHRIFG